MKYFCNLALNELGPEVETLDKETEMIVKCKNDIAFYFKLEIFLF